MATYTSVFSPAGNAAGGGNEDIIKYAAVAVNTATATRLMGLRQKFVVTCTASPGATAAAVLAACTIRFTLSTSTASATGTATDFGIPMNQPMQFDTGDNFDTIGMFNTNTAAGGTIDIYVMRLAN